MPPRWTSHFMTEADFRQYRNEALCGVTGTDCASPADVPHKVALGQPSTVLSPEGTARYMTLAECLALAMENGRTTDNFETAETRRLLPAPTFFKQVQVYRSLCNQRG